MFCSLPLCILMRIAATSTSAAPRCSVGRHDVPHSDDDDVMLHQWEGPTVGEGARLAGLGIVSYPLWVEGASCGRLSPASRPVARAVAMVTIDVGRCCSGWRGSSALVNPRVRRGEPFCECMEN